MNSKLPIIIIGAGHAGIEAAFAVSRLNHPAILITQDLRAFARASCNPAIGGLAKGHIVKEIDALGGIMGQATDFAAVQYKTLNQSKGRAVWSPRAQIDKRLYSRYLYNKITGLKNVDIIQDEAIGFDTMNGTISKVITKNHNSIQCISIIIAGGTFLNGLVHIGERQYSAGRFAETPSTQLSTAISHHGIRFLRLKTGTPPRLLSSSINWSLCTISNGDSNTSLFSANSSNKTKKNIACHTVSTNLDVHNNLLDSLELSSMYSGSISGIGPRYCPSIEDKIVRFSNRDSHQLFLEPEFLDSNQIYVNGFSTSMPLSVQKQSLRRIPALKDAIIIRPGYAIEYDYFPSSQLKSTLESKIVPGLFFAGQVNGTSGYEEAAAQGLIAGINAVLKAGKREPFILRRKQAYIGVLIDDLITKSIDEPYRMFTSSAEYRLSLRADNADIRLSPIAADLGLITKTQSEIFNNRLESIQKIKEIFFKTNVIDSESNLPKKLNDYLKKPKSQISNNSSLEKLFVNFPQQNIFTAETDIKYEGYVQRENKRVASIEKYEYSKIPEDFDYDSIVSISNEAREKLKKVRPETLGQASRISGVNPSSIAILSILLKQK